MVFLCKAISIDRFWGGGGGGGGALLLNFLFQNSVPIIRKKITISCTDLQFLINKQGRLGKEGQLLLMFHRQ